MENNQIKYRILYLIDVLNNANTAYYVNNNNVVFDFTNSVIDIYNN